jgi:hypothetical protein
VTLGIDFGRLMQQMGQQLEVLPVGNYDVVVKTADATTTANGKPMIKVKFSIENGPHAGRTLYNNFTISEENQNALLIFFTQMKALGLESTFFAAGPSLEQVAAQLVGKRAQVAVAHRQWNGATQPNITRLNPPIGGQGAGPVGGGFPAPPIAGPAPTTAAAPPAPPVAAPAAQQPVAPPAAPPAPPAPEPLVESPTPEAAPAAPSAPPQEAEAPAPAPAPEAVAPAPQPPVEAAAAAGGTPPPVPF